MGQETEQEKTGILAHIEAPRDAPRNSRVRRAWTGAGVASVLLFGTVAAFGTLPGTAELRIPQHAVIENLPAFTAEALQEETAFYVREERIQRGDTVVSLLSKLGIQDDAAFAFIVRDSKTRPLFRQLVPGKVLTAKTDETGALISLSFPLNGADDRVLRVEKVDGEFEASEQPLDLDAEVLVKAGQIRSSLFAATDAVGLPDRIAVQMADIFSGDVDFHRDLRRGDRFNVVYEMLSHQGQPVRSGRILAAEFTNQGKTFQAIWFESKAGRGYYTLEGKNIRKAFLRSPLEFSRITSGFSGARRHPVLQTVRAHKGIDYGAPMGTRVKATGNGIVDFVGWRGGYGNMIVLRHQSSYSTAYGHMNGFAKGLHRGMRVSQGDVIGYVGRTGLATGPHLHYEFRVNGTQRNPLSIALPAAPPLPAKILTEFHAHAKPLADKLAQVRSLNLAQLD